MLRKTGKSNLAFVVSSALMAACSPLQKMDEMNTTTKHMNGTTTKMAESTSQMADTTASMGQDTNKMSAQMGTMSEGMTSLENQMKLMTTDLKKMSGNMVEMKGHTGAMSGKMDALSTLTASLYGLAEAGLEDGRQKGSTDLRRDSVESMEKETLLSAKLLRAAQFFMSFEFQLWRGAGSDTPEKYEMLEKNAAEEFGLTLAKLFEKKFTQSASFSDESMKDLYAIAGSVHQINPNTQLRDKQGRTKARSMLHLLEAALTAKQSGKELSASGHQILEFKKYAALLLQLRINFIGAVVLSKVMEVSEPAFLEKALTNFKVFAQKKWTPSSAVPDPTERAMLTHVANEALRTHGLLKGIGIEVHVDENIFGIFKAVSASVRASNPEEIELVRAIQSLGTL